VRATKSAEALHLFGNVWRVIQGEGCLPRELKRLLLKKELMVDDSRFRVRR